MRRFSKADRVGDLLLRRLSEGLLAQKWSEILRTVTIHEVRLSRDIGVAKIFWRTFLPQGRTQAEEALKTYGDALRAKVAGTVRLRRMPELRWTWDESEDRAEHIEDILRELKKDDG